MRILLTNTLFPPVIKGGAEVSTHSLGKALALRGHDVHVITIDPSEASTREQDGMTVHRVTPAIVGYPYDKDERTGIGKLGFHLVDNYNPTMRRKLSDIMSRINPEVVHSNILQLLTCAVWLSAKDVGAKVVHNLRDYWLLCARSGFFRNGEPCSRKCLDCKLVSSPRRWLTGHVDGVVAVGQYVLDTHLEAGLFPNAKVSRAILSATATPTGFSRGARADSAITLGFIGRIKESKGLRVLLEAMRQLPAGQPIRLLVAGDGEPEYMAEMRSIADDRTTFLGWCRPEELYGMVDIVVVPSLYPEPLPRSILEAYRYGLPVIGARSGGIPEVIDHGRTGWIYDGLDVQGLARLIEQLPGANGLSSLSTEERDKIVARTNPDFVVQAYEQVYATVLLGRHGSG